MLLLSMAMRRKPLMSAGITTACTVMLASEHHLAACSPAEFIQQACVHQHTSTSPHTGAVALTIAVHQ